MSYVDERQIIETTFLSTWLSDTTPVKLDNVPGLVKGTGRLASESKLAEWCHLSIAPGGANQADMNGTKRIRSVGTIVVNVFVKAGTGTERVRELSNQVLGALQLKELATGFATRAGRVVNSGQTPDSSWYQMSVQIPFYRDSYHL